MSTGLTQFLADLEAFDDEVEAELVQFHKKVALSFLQEVVAKTPVDTGRAQSNWRTGVETVPTGVLPSAGTSRQAAFERAEKEALNAFTSLKPFSIVWVTNNLPYIEPINTGHSAKASPRWIERSLQDVESKFGD